MRGHWERGGEGGRAGGRLCESSRSLQMLVPASLQLTSLRPCPATSGMHATASSCSSSTEPCAAGARAWLSKVHRRALRCSAGVHGLGTRSSAAPGGAAGSQPPSAHLAEAARFSRSSSFHSRHCCRHARRRRNLPPMSTSAAAARSWARRAMAARQASKAAAWVVLSMR